MSSLKDQRAAFSHLARVTGGDPQHIAYEVGTGIHPGDVTFPKKQ